MTVFASETPNTLVPVAPIVDAASRRAAKSRAVNRDLTCDQYGIWPVAPEVGRVHTHAMPSPGTGESQTVPSHPLKDPLAPVRP
jgi:hypothetical protein